MPHRTIFLCRHRDVIASFFGVWSVQTCFLQRDVFEVLQRILPFYELLIISTYFYLSTDHDVIPWTEERHVWPYYGHLKCARCRDKGVGDDSCVLKKDFQSARCLPQSRFNSLPPPPTEIGRANTRRFLPPLSPLSWTLHKSVCWDG